MTVRSYGGVSPSLGTNVMVDESALVLGDVVIGDDSAIWPMTVVRGDVNKIRIGQRTNIQDGSVLHVTHPHKTMPEGFALTVGDNVTVGHKVVLHGCEVGDNCLIGMSTTIMDGAIVEPFTFVGAGSLVSPGKVLEGGYLWLGSPVRKARELTEAERQWIGYSAKHYVELKNKHMQAV
jgi:carbonic anhydrase/acetyltransferase-like protein (isoleucine patch superfamily)